MNEAAALPASVTGAIDAQAALPATPVVDANGATPQPVADKTAAVDRTAAPEKTQGKPVSLAEKFYRKMAGNVTTEAKKQAPPNPDLQHTADVLGFMTQYDNLKPNTVFTPPGEIKTNLQPDGQFATTPDGKPNETAYKILGTTAEGDLNVVRPDGSQAILKKTDLQKDAARTVAKQCEDDKFKANLEQLGLSKEQIAFIEQSAKSAAGEKRTDAKPDDIDGVDRNVFLEAATSCGYLTSKDVQLVVDMRMQAAKDNPAEIAKLQALKLRLSQEPVVDSTEYFRNILETTGIMASADSLQAQKVIIDSQVKAAETELKNLPAEQAQLRPQMETRLNQLRAQQKIIDELQKTTKTMFKDKPNWDLASTYADVLNGKANLNDVKNQLQQFDPANLDKLAGDALRGIERNQLTKDRLGKAVKYGVGIPAVFILVALLAGVSGMSHG